MALLPAWLEPQIELARQVQDTLFVIDISESMNVPDADAPAPRSPRLELAKAATRTAMSALDCGSRVSLALFAGEDSLVLFEPLELCRHFPAIDQVLSGLDTGMRWIGDSRIEVGLRHAIGEAQARKLNVVFVTDGDETPQRSSPHLAELERLHGKVQGVLMAVGGEAALPVPRLDARGRVSGYWTAEEAVLQGFHPNVLALVKALPPGQRAPAGALDAVGEHLSAARPGHLKLLAQSAGLAFVQIRQPADAVAPLRQAAMGRVAAAMGDARWMLCLLALALTLAGWGHSAFVGSDSGKHPVDMNRAR